MSGGAAELLQDVVNSEMRTLEMADQILSPILFGMRRVSLQTRMRPSTVTAWYYLGFSWHVQYRKSVFRLHCP